MGAYKSDYTGHEVDLAVGRILGNNYQEGSNPGCSLIGDKQDLSQNLYDVNIPGKYTIFFYYDVGPDGKEIEMPWMTRFETTFISPLFMQVSDEGNHEWQRIYIGASLYYRDIRDTNNDYTWKYVDLGVQATEIIDNLISDRTDAALSANMGRELKSIINGLAIGNINLIDNSGLVRSDEGWNWLKAHNEFITRDTTVTVYNRPSFSIKAIAWPNAVDFLSVAVKDDYCAEALYGMTYTASILIQPHTADAKLYIQLRFEDASHVQCAGRKTEITLQPSTSWKRISVTLQNTSVNAEYIRVSFGVSNNAWVHFALPKLEWGVYGTQWMPSYYDMWTEFDNANFINEVPVNIAYDNAGNCLIKDQQTIVYDDTKGEFVNESVAVGGGGGFVQSVDPPVERQVLWYRLPRYGASSNIGLGDSYRNVYKLYRNRHANSDAVDNASAAYFGITDGGENAQWVKVVPPVFAQFNKDDWAGINDADRAWLNNTEEDDLHPAVLNYYDYNRKTWRAIGAAPSVNWVIDDNPPEDTDRMWIQTPQFILKFYHDGAWVPIHAIWGENIKTEDDAIKDGDSTTGTPSEPETPEVGGDEEDNSNTETPSDSEETDTDTQG